MWSDALGRSVSWRFRTKLEPGLYVETMCGLCNRMRVIDSGLFLARKIGKPLHVLWKIDRDLGCAFDDLFVVPDQIASIETLDCLKAGYKKVERIERRRRKAATVALLQSDWEKTWDRNYNFDMLGQEITPYLWTWERFYPPEFRRENWTPTFDFTSPLGHRQRDLRKLRQNPGQYLHPPYSRPFSLFRPVETLLEKILTITCKFESTVGVHVRRTDNPNQERSPTELFELRMRREIERDDRTTFFLATDDPAEEDHLKRIFPDRIFTHPKRSRDRSTREAIEDAVVDLYCLSETDLILGSYYSSFSETAMMINGAPFQEMTSDAP